MNCFSKYLQDRKGTIIVAFLCTAIFSIVFALYEFPLQALLYPTGLCLIFIVIYNAMQYAAFQKKHKTIQTTSITQENIDTVFSKYKKQDDIDYQNSLLKILADNLYLSAQISTDKQDMLDYYTLWVHQIKTPIASMDLLLQAQDTKNSRKIAEELFRIRQYVDMALTYQRLDSLETDYLFEKCSLNNLLKESLRKFSPLFINKTIKLHFSLPEIEMITDKKWFSFMFEQLLSNALKYTRQGGEISIYFKNGDTLFLQDTGIGINAADLPRIFEKGYTGFNGRSDKCASGLGLYLCKRISENLGEEIKIVSSSKGGTIAEIQFPKNKVQFV